MLLALSRLRSPSSLNRGHLHRPGRAMVEAASQAEAAFAKHPRGDKPPRVDAAFAKHPPGTSCHRPVWRYESPNTAVSAPSAEAASSRHTCTARKCRCQPHRRHEASIQGTEDVLHFFHLRGFSRQPVDFPNIRPIMNLQLVSLRRLKTSRDPSR